MFIKREESLLLFDKQQDERSINSIFLLFFVYFGTILLSGIISPFIYKFVIFLSNSFSNSFVDYLAKKDFADYIDRTRFCLVIISLVFITKFFRFRPLKSFLFGCKWYNFYEYFVLGVSLVLILVLLQFINGKIIFSGISTFFVLKFFFAGIFLGFLEEIIFRGIIFRMFYSVIKSPILSILFSSFFFAYVHFKQNIDFSSQIDVFESVKYSFSTIFRIFYIFDSIYFSNIFMFGTFSSLLFLHTKSLNPGIRFHQGLIFAMLSAKHAFLDNKSSIHSKFLGTIKITNSLIACLVMILFSIFLIYKLKTKSSNPKNSIY